MKKKSSGRDEKPRMSPSAIILSGVFCAALLLLTGIGVRHIYVRSSPTQKNSERLLAMGKPAEAMALLDRMPREKRPDAAALVHRGKVLYGVLLEQMREERWGSYGVHPGNWLAHPLAAEAEQCFLDAMAQSPNDPEIRRILGSLYREQGRFGDAEIILRSAIEVDDSDAEAFLALGLLYAEGGRLPAARKALALAWELDEGNPKIAKNIAYFHRFYANAPESSIVWFSRYIDSNPQRDPDINLIKAELRELLERYPEFGGYKRDSDAPVNRGANRKFVSPIDRRK